VTPWLEALRAVAQPAAGALPALVVVVFAGLLVLLGLFFGASGRAYALAAADRGRRSTREKSGGYG